ncbi:MAG: trypsin-like peptidase domain-containing protein [Oscillospiraceae bacterium]|nr:trypsin-like peptidase domain-containing protein [Oscillospiraceae bacterium]
MNSNNSENNNRKADGGYRYDPVFGWQKGARQDSGANRTDGYRWDFNEYDAAGRGRQRRGRGIVVFLAGLFGVVIIGMFAITGYSILLELNGSPLTLGEGQASAAASVPEPDAPSGEAPTLELTSRPGTQELNPGGGRLTIPEIARKISPAVVGVSAFDEGSRFYEPVSVGSGIVMTEDGYVITNAHVVAPGTSFKIQLHDATPYDAQLIGLDTTTDLAVLKVDVAGLVPAVFGDSDEIEVGETVVAIGNPSGIELAGSVTRGIVSAVNRMVTTENYQFIYLQTDAAINPGNSGGALVNEFGQVIGINSSKIVAQGYEGIGFAIPITNAKPILDDIIKNGRVTGRVMLGISCKPVTEVDALRYDIPMGLEIHEIYEGSDLIGKDVQRGDILIEIDSIRVRTLPDVQAILSERKVGDEVTLKFYRRLSAVQSVEFDVTIVLVEN